MSHNPAMSTTDKFERHYRQQLSALVDGELNADESRFCCAVWPMTKNWPAATNGGSCAAMCCAVRPARRHRWTSQRVCARLLPRSPLHRRNPLRARRRAGAGVVARRLRHRSRRSPCSWRASVCPRRRRLPPRCRCSLRPRRCPPQCSRLQRRKRRRHRIRPHPTRVSRSLQRCLPLRWLPPVAVRPRAISRRPAVSLPASSRRRPAWWPLPRRHRLLQLCARPRRRTRSRIPR